VKYGSNTEGILYTTFITTLSTVAITITTTTIKFISLLTLLRNDIIGTLTKGGGKKSKTEGETAEKRVGLSDVA